MIAAVSLLFARLVDLEKEWEEIKKDDKEFFACESCMQLYHETNNVILDVHLNRNLMNL
jgi:hypothetical protein